MKYFCVAFHRIRVKFDTYWNTLYFVKDLCSLVCIQLEKINNWGTHGLLLQAYILYILCLLSIQWDWVGENFIIRKSFIFKIYTFTHTETQTHINTDMGKQYKFCSWQSDYTQKKDVIKNIRECTPCNSWHFVNYLWMPN